MAKDLQFEVVWINPNELTPYVNNTKKHPVEQLDKIAQQIAKFGFDQPIVVNKDKVIIKGHGRREASIRLGLKAVPVIVRTDLKDEYEEMALRIADNRVAQSDWDEDLLSFELETLDRNGFDLQYTGFDNDEIKKILEAGEEALNTPDLSGSNVEPEQKQYILTIELKTEGELAELYKEMKDKGFNCTMIA